MIWKYTLLDDIGYKHMVFIFDELKDIYAHNFLKKFLIEHLNLKNPFYKLKEIKNLMKNYCRKKN